MNSSSDRQTDRQRQREIMEPTGRTDIETDGQSDERERMKHRQTKERREAEA